MEIEDYFIGAAGERIAVRRYLPSRPKAIIIMAHGFAAVRAMKLYEFAEKFSADGYAVLVFDYRHFGDSEGEPRNLMNIDKRHADWDAMIAHSKQEPKLGHLPLVLWGTSFAGGHVMHIAAQRSDVAAVIAQVPFTSATSTVAVTHPWSVLAVSATAVADTLAGLVGLGPLRVPAAGKPGSNAAMTSPDAVSGFEALMPGSEPPEIPARIILQTLLYNPVKNVDKIQCPLLVQTGDRDELTPPGPSQKAAEKAPLGRHVRYDAGHFDVYLPPLFDRVVADQLHFLKEALDESPS